MTHSVAIIDACRPWHWRDKFPPTNAPSAEVARKAREKFGWLLDSPPSFRGTPNGSGPLGSAR
jgi:hypothetical protein